GHASGSGGHLEFQCQFRAIPSSIPFRKAIRTEKPKVAGLQTAIVTGSDTDEDIAVDQYGRVQVNFHWNMPDKPNAKCSCPVRVASPWAGKGWGAVSIPRVGQEVVVSFLEGDPDRPLIIGSVYNAANTVPYGLPDNKTQSGIKSRSLLGGTDQTETIKHDRKVTVQNDDKLDVTANGTTTIGQKFKLDAGTEIDLVCGASSITLKASGDIEIKGVNFKITGDATVKMAGQATVDIGAGASVKVHSDAMMNVEGGAMTTVKGAMLTLTGDGMAKLGGGITMIG